MKSLLKIASIIIINIIYLNNSRAEWLTNEMGAKVSTTFFAIGNNSMDGQWKLSFICLYNKLENTIIRLEERNKNSYPLRSKHDIIVIINENNFHMEMKTQDNINGKVSRLETAPSSYYEALMIMNKIALIDGDFMMKISNKKITFNENVYAEDVVRAFMRECK